MDRNPVDLLFRIYCKRGRMSLDKLPDTPPEMQHLFDPDMREGRQFVPNIRAYNLVPSQGAIVESAVAGGVRKFRIKGQVCYEIGPPIPDRTWGYTPIFAQLYIIDITQEQQDARLALMPPRPNHVRSSLDLAHFGHCNNSCLESTH